MTGTVLYSKMRKDDILGIPKICSNMEPAKKKYFYKDKELHEHIYFFGMSFNCEPEGIWIKKEVKIILE